MPAEQLISPLPKAQQIPIRLGILKPLPKTNFEYLDLFVFDLTVSALGVPPIPIYDENDRSRKKLPISHYPSLKFNLLDANGKIVNLNNVLLPSHYVLAAKGELFEKECVYKEDPNNKGEYIPISLTYNLYVYTKELLDMNVLSASEFKSKLDEVLKNKETELKDQREMMEIKMDNLTKMYKEEILKVITELSSVRERSNQDISLASVLLQRKIAGFIESLHLSEDFTSTMRNT